MECLNDPRIKSVVKWLAGMASFDVSPGLQAGRQAYLEAIAHPGSLIRVTCTVDDLDDILRIIIHDEGVDYEKCLIKRPRSEPVTIEFKNGSGIEIVLAKRAR